MLTPSRSVEYLVIGAGTAGLNARRAIAAASRDYLVADPGPLGTTCARVGCMPSKLLIAAADRALELRREERFGVTSLGARIDGVAVLRRVRAERDRFVGFVVRDMQEWAPAHLLPHPARFVAPMTVAVGDEIIRANRIVLAVGSRPTLTPEQEALGEVALTTDQLFELEDLPRSVAVVGAGVIGLEMGQALSRLGVQTRIFGRRRSLGAMPDPELRAEIEEILGAEVGLTLDAQVSWERTPAGALARWRGPDGEALSQEFERVLVAAGRRSNVDRLALASSGLALDERGRPVHDPLTLQCVGTDGQPAGVFVAGDEREDIMILHEASDEGRAAGQAAVDWPHPRPRQRRVPLAMVFCEPNIVTLGLPWREIDPARHAVGRVSFQDQGRSRVMGVGHGSLKIFGERGTGLLVGAVGVGPRLEHIAHLLSWSVGAGLTVDAALDMPFYHPVIEEGVRTALRDLKKNLS